MQTRSRPEKVAHLVISASDAEKNTQHGHVHDYKDIYEFIDAQPPATDMRFTWHYLDPQLRRRLVLTCTKQAISLATSSLEIPRFTVESHEFYADSHSETMGMLVLNASGLFEAHSSYDHYIQVGMQNPDALYTRYHALRQRTAEQLSRSDTPTALGGLDTPIRELGSRAPAA